MQFRPSFQSPTWRNRRVAALSQYSPNVPIVVEQSRPQAQEIPLGPDGLYRQIPLDGLTSDASQIVGTLNQLAEQFGTMPEVREFTVSVLGLVANNDISQQVYVIADFVRSKMIYVLDPAGTEYIISPCRLIEQIQTQGYSHGDCDDHVLLLNSMLRSIGLNAVAVAVKLYQADYHDHVISSVDINGVWRDIDPCAKNGYQPTYTQQVR